MQKNFQIVHKWCKWPDLLYSDPQQFFKKASDKIGEEVDDLDNYIVVIAEELGAEQMPVE